MCFMFPSNVMQLASDEGRENFIWFSFRNIVTLEKTHFDHKAPSKI